MAQGRPDLWLLFLACTLATLGACANNPQGDPASNVASDGASTHNPRWLRPTSGIRGIFEDSRGILYFTSPDWNCRYDPSKRDSEEGGFTYFNQGAAGVLASGFQEDSNGLLWNQSVDGIYSYDGEEFAPITHRNYDAKHQWAMAEGDLWFGADGGVELNEEEREWGVYRLHDGECTWLAFPEPPAGERARFYALTSKAMRGKDGTLWFGTFNAAFGFDGESFDIIGRERMGLGDDPRHIGIRGYHMDSKGNLWMADNGAGVFVYDGTEVLHFTALHDLEDGDTDGNSLHRSFSIAEDDEGNLWFGTAYSGIWRYEPSEHDPIAKGKFTNYDDEEGWPCENTWTIYRRPNGELLFAGEKPGGVYRFDGEGFERVF